MSSKKKLRGVVRIPKDALWMSEYSSSIDAKGNKTHLAWPTLDNTSWFDDVRRFTNQNDNPRYVVHESKGIKRHWKLACYTEDGWWFSHDEERSSDVEFHTRLFIPRELQYHPNAPEEEKCEKK